MSSTSSETPLGLYQATRLRNIELLLRVSLTMKYGAQRVDQAIKQESYLVPKPPEPTDEPEDDS